MPNEKSKGNIVTRFSDMEKSGKRTEWICSHGIGHHQGIHGCDGCCVDEPEMEKTTKDDFQRESIPSKNPMEECGHGLDEICDICDMTPNIKKELSECCGAEKIPLIDGKRVEVDNCIECGKPFFSSKNPMEEKIRIQYNPIDEKWEYDEPPQEEDWKDTLREIIYSNWKKEDEVGLFVAVRSLIEARVQEVKEEYAKQNDGVLGRNIEYIKGVIKDVQKEERERILKAVKEKGLHLGYKNELLDIINNES